MEIIYNMLAAVFTITKPNSDKLNLPNQNPISAGTIQGVLSLIFSLLGGVAFLFIIYGGIKMITSEGTPEVFAKARNTIIYAVIGLVICISAFTIVNFVVDRVG